jgi:hypothetical protein
MNIDLFFGLLKDKYGITFPFDVKLKVLETTTSSEVAEILGIKFDIEREFALAHTLSISYAEYRRILHGGRES